MNIRPVIRGIWISLIVGMLAGTASAFFLGSLDRVTDFRELHPWIIVFLPAGGFLVGWVYHRFGKEAEAGHSLIVDEIHDPRKIVPLRLAPLVLFGTLATHFFGGSAGREGTAVQMGGALADQLTRQFRLKSEERPLLLMAGMSAGFASVFGTPLAGAVFGLEVLSFQKSRSGAVFSCLISALVAHLTTLAWGIKHTSYETPSVPSLTPGGLLLAAIAGVVFGVVGLFFVKTTHGISGFFKNKVSYSPLRPAIGGVIVAIVVWAIGSTKYIGLGIPTILEAFKSQLPRWDWALKLLLTVLTLGSGFKGGEVTPLFFIGATLGNALAPLLSLPSPLLAAMGFVAVFAGAAKTPLTCSFMAVEIFGPDVGVFAGIACALSYLLSGKDGIYRPREKSGSQAR